jgi:enolase
MPKIPITNISARTILDSRANPTLEVTVTAGKATGVFGVPSGASTGSAEALELRDNGKEFLGKGVDKAVDNVNEAIAKKIKGMDVFDQLKIDNHMIKFDGTPNKSRYGANAILGVSGAIAKAAAAAKKQPVYKYIASLHKNKKLKLPKPMFNLINGGLHGDTNLDIQEFMVVPLTNSPKVAVRMAAEVFLTLKKVLQNRQLGTNVGNEGGYSPKVESNRQVLDLLIEAIKQAGYEKGKDIALALDVAATNIFQEHDKQYVLSADRTSLSGERLVSLYKEWAEAYSIISIEDGLAEEDWLGWQAMTKRLGDKFLLVGDDLFVTQVPRLQKGIDMTAANAIIIKPNQVGTITEALETVKLAQKNNYKVIASHRSGETNDDFIADFAVGVGADYLKAGAPSRGERVAKYNRLMKIEEEIG